MVLEEQSKALVSFCEYKSPGKVWREHVHNFLQQKMVWWTTELELEPEHGILTSWSRVKMLGLHNTGCRDTSVAYSWKVSQGPDCRSPAVFLQPVRQVLCPAPASQATRGECPRWPCCQQGMGAQMDQELIINLYFGKIINRNLLRFRLKFLLTKQYLRVIRIWIYLRHIVHLYCIQKINLLNLMHTSDVWSSNNKKTVWKTFL